MLVADRGRQYLEMFFDARIFDPSAVDQSDPDIYASAYSTPGAMRAGFEVYRAFDRDVKDNRDALGRNGSSKCRCWRFSVQSATPVPDVPRFFQPLITEDSKIAANSFGVR